jgi:(E)-4-hydroxy-3-methylbut-2-enyl-diphosphate synthase
MANNIHNYYRRKTNPVNIGGIWTGSDYPIRIQSMVNTPASNVKASVEQCIRIANAGADYVRFAVPSVRDIEHIASIRNELKKRGRKIPVIADVHFNPEIALGVIDHVDKVRINPGNFSKIEKFIPLVEKCRLQQVALRIGVNHGSLSEKIMNLYGDTPLGMAESAMEFLRICRERKFDQVVVSMKASNVRIMVMATRLIVHMMSRENMHYPLHLGVTEAGEGEDGRIKSACGIGTLLAEGLGDTIRVSLTEDPENEIPVARKIIGDLNTIIPAPALPLTGPFSKERYKYEPRRSVAVGEIGGDHPPVVIGADRVIQERIKLVHASFAQFTSVLVKDLVGETSSVLVYHCTNDNIQAELNWLRNKLEESGCVTPVIFQLQLNETDLDNFQIKSALGLGGAFIDGFGDGIWLTNEPAFSEDHFHSTSFAILQACRARITRTEYISCPSCGRTNFNLMNTLSKIKAATSHLKGLKIGVMGCIVNGPGEMADADYGYVGSGKGKITLFKSRKIVKTGISEADAVSELIKIIKENHEWIEP